MNAATSWVSKQANRCGGEACVRETRIPVWGLVNLRRLGADDGALLRAYPVLSPADLEVAFAYADAHPGEIDDAIRVNEQGDEGAVE